MYEDKKQYASNPFDNSTIETGDALINNMKEEKKKRWEGVITTTNMTHNSRKAWKTIRNVSNDPASSTPPCLVIIIIMHLYSASIQLPAQWRL